MTTVREKSIRTNPRSRNPKWKIGDRFRLRYDYDWPGDKFSAKAGDIGTLTLVSYGPTPETTVAFAVFDKAPSQYPVAITMKAIEKVRAKRKKNPDAYVIETDWTGGKMTYDANSRRFSDSRKPSLYATKIAAEERLALLKKNFPGVNALKVARVRKATDAERGSVYGARVRRGNPDFPAARSGGPLWEYKDSRGVTVRGRVEKTFDKGGTDVTYMMRRETGEIDMLSGSRLKAAKVLRENPRPKK